MMPAESASPREVSVSRETRSVTVRWQDGHQSLYAFDMLRRACPCALCNDQRAKRILHGEMSLTVLSAPVVKPGEIQLADLRPVGRYAFSFAWSDGHDLGIYAYSYLRELCPCSECHPER